jgi:hypothetical protein
MNGGDAALEADGFKRYCGITWNPAHRTMALIEPIAHLGVLTYALYAFVIGGTVVRIGKYQPRVSERLQWRATIGVRFVTDLPECDVISYAIACTDEAIVTEQKHGR